MKYGDYKYLGYRFTASVKLDNMFHGIWHMVNTQKKLVIMIFPNIINTIFIMNFTRKCYGTYTCKHSKMYRAGHLKLCARWETNAVLYIN